MNSNPEKHMLFCYGTLMDADIQQALFNKTFNTTQASLPGWGLFECPENSYFFIKPDDANCVHGCIIELDQDDLEIADYWEAVPLYQRETATVTDAHGQGINTWVYTRRNARGIPHTGAVLAGKDKQAILAEILASDP